MAVVLASIRIFGGRGTVAQHGVLTMMPCVASVPRNTMVDIQTMRNPEESLAIWTWPWSRHPQPDGEAAVQIDAAGGLFVDPEEVAKSKSFQKQLKVMSDLPDIDTR